MVPGSLSLCIAFNFCNASRCANAKTIIKTANRKLGRHHMISLLPAVGLPHSGYPGVRARSRAHRSAAPNEMPMLMDQTNRQAAPRVMERLEQSGPDPDHARRGGASEIAQAEIKSPSPIPSGYAYDRLGLPWRQLGKCVHRPALLCFVCANIEFRPASRRHTVRRRASSDRRMPVSRELMGACGVSD
jgi:hypothetical protein